MNPGRFFPLSLLREGEYILLIAYVFIDLSACRIGISAELNTMEKKSLIDITVNPKSSRKGIVLNEDNSLRVYLNSPPVDNRANDECVKLFSRALGISKSRISIEKGHSSRKKTLLVLGMNPDEIMGILKTQSTSPR